MIPRTVRAAAAVASQLTPTELEDYGNIILNGYAYNNGAVSTAGAKGPLDSVTISAAGTNFANGTYNNVYLSSLSGSFAYADVVVAGNVVTTVTVTTGGNGFVVGETLYLNNLPRTASGAAAQLTVAQVISRGVRPAMKGWSTNYQSWFTGLPPNAYNAYPGMPTQSQYLVRSYTPFSGPIASIGGNNTWFYGGRDYALGTYTGIALSGGSGAGATATFVVADVIPLNKGPIYSYTVTEQGQGYFPAGSPAPAPISATGIGIEATFAGTADALSPYGLTITGVTNRGYNYAPYDLLVFPGGSKVVGTPLGSSIDAVVQVDVVGYRGVAYLVSLDNPGTGYQIGDVLTAALPGGFGLSMPVGAIVLGSNGGGEPRYGQPTKRFNANGYSFSYPQGDRTAEPPIGLV